MNSRSLSLPSSGLARTGTALHRQVYLVLRDRLLSGAIAPQAQLPPEPALCAQFGVSRITLRRAVADLEQDGLLRRVQGRGTFAIAPAAPAHARSDGYVDDLRQLSADTSVQVLELDTVPAPAWVADRLRIPAGERVQRSLRRRLRHRVPVVLLAAWVPQRWAEGITRTELAHRALHELLRQRGLRFGRILQEISACLADPLQAQWLEVSVGAALLQVDRLVHDRAGTPVELVGMTLSSERSRMVLDTPAELVEHVSSGRFIHKEPARARPR